MKPRRRLLFISPQFLFPADAGGKIRTTGILRGLKNGAFEITLASPALAGQADGWKAALEEICDHVVFWPDATEGLGGKVRRALAIFESLPITVAVGRSSAAAAVIERELREGCDVAVFDYAHTGIFLPDRLAASSVCFTHNVETEILQRHAAVESNPVLTRVWQSQHRKMQRYEREVLPRFDTIIAVSDRDAQSFRKEFGLTRVESIPTGVDLDYFQFAKPSDLLDKSPTVVFSGSMDWRANIDGIQWFIDAIWPQVTSAEPRARLVVVGRNPPDTLVARYAAAGSGVEFTGFVDDVRPFVRRGDVYAIPLRIGGGTRIKAYEAMAMGVPIVSTALGVEGLPVNDGEHLTLADDPASFAAAIVALFGNHERRCTLATAARTLVEVNFGAKQVASIFERICLDTLAKSRTA